MKKSQAAMEFLMTYGWAIIVVIAAIGALAYFGVLKPEQFIPEKCVIASTSGLYCEDFTADDLNDITIRIKNVADKSAAINSIIIATGISGIGKTVCTSSGSASIAKDSSADFAIGTGCDLESGDKIKGNIIINYQRDDFNKTTTGSLTSYVSEAGGEPGISGRDICQNAEDSSTCGGLDLIFGAGYQSACCEDYGLCC